VHQRARPFLADYQGGQFQPYADIARQIPKFTTGQDVILCPTKLARIMTFLADRTFSEPNEPITAAPGHLFVIIDPKDVYYRRWLAAMNVSPQGEALVTVARLRSPLTICLSRARIDPEPK